MDYVRPRLEFPAARILDTPLTAIVILALVALFIGLRLYSVLGERTGHEQPILKPADPDARIEPRLVPAQVAVASSADSSGMAFLPTAGPGVRAILSADPTFDVARFLDGAKGAYRLVLESFCASRHAFDRLHAETKCEQS